MYTFIVGSQSFVVENQAAHEFGQSAQKAYRTGDFESAKSLLAQAIRAENNPADAIKPIILKKAA